MILREQLNECLIKQQDRLANFLTTEASTTSH